MSRNYQYENLPQACKCVDCGYVLENPKKHCIDLKCPKCGAKMRRAKSSDNSVTTDDRKYSAAGGDHSFSVLTDGTDQQKVKKMEEFAKKWIEQGLYDPNDFDDDGFSKQMTAEERKRIPEKLGTGGYACHVGDKWKLPIHNEGVTRNAMARYNQAEGCQTADVKGRICAAARHFNVEGAFETGGFCAGGKKMENDLEGTSGEPEKSALLETYKQAILDAKTSEEMEKAKEDYIRAKIIEEERQKRLDHIEKEVINKHEHEMSKLPDRMEKLEEMMKTLTDKIGELIEKTDARFQKIEEVPALKTPAPSEVDEVVSNFEKQIEKTGDIDHTLDWLNEEYRKSQLEATA